MKPTVIIQARLGSNRLPKKVLKPILGQPLLYYLLKRLEGLKTPCRKVVATTTDPLDNPIVEYCKEFGVDTFRGSIENVLERFYKAALKYPSDVYVRITADCPLVDPSLLDQMLLHFIQKSPSVDYLSNTLKRSYPKGLDIEIFTFKALEKAYLNAKTPYEKEHVTPYIYQNKDLFTLSNIEDSEDLSKINISVDTMQDFVLVEKILEKAFSTNPYFGITEIKKQLRELECIPCKLSPPFLK